VESTTAWLADMSEAYDQYLAPALMQPFAEQLAARAAEVRPGRVLEVAAGTGVVTRELLRRVPNSHLVASDLNVAMVDRARRQVAGADWLVADASTLPIRSAAADLVVCQFGAMFFPDKPRAFAEAARTLVPGGRLLLAVWDTVETSVFPRVMLDGLRAVLPDATPDFFVRVPHGYADPDVVCADLAAGGLPDATVERVVLPGRAASARSLAVGFCTGTPLRFALEQRGPLPELTSRLGEEMTRRLGSGEVAGDLAAYVYTARRR
jgi:SAM-dependent methyltransferase